MTGLLGDRSKTAPVSPPIRDLLPTVPGPQRLDGLRAHRGPGRDDYPVTRLWHIVRLTIALRPISFNACLAEWHRNPALCRRIGSTSEEQVPNGWNRSRFLDVLGPQPHRAARRAVLDTWAQRLGQAVPDWGRPTAGDAPALSARAPTDLPAAQAESARGLPPPTGGRKEHTDDEGNGTKVVEWFGYKLHLLVDVKHDVSLASDRTDTQVGDHEPVEALVSEAEANWPASRMETRAYDKAADDAKAHACWYAHGARPVMQNRALWQEEPERPLPGGRYPLHLVHEESGTVHCRDTVGNPPVRHQMAYIGYEHDRKAIP